VRSRGAFHRAAKKVNQIGEAIFPATLCGRFHPVMGNRAQALKSLVRGRLIATLSPGAAAWPITLPFVSTPGVQSRKYPEFPKESQCETSGYFKEWRLSHVLSFAFWFWINENSSQQAAALVDSFILLPISQSVHAHRTKPTELLNFDVFGSGAL